MGGVKWVGLLYCVRQVCYVSNIMSVRCVTLVILCPSGVLR